VSLHQRQTSIADVLRGQAPVRSLPFVRGWLRHPMSVGLPFPSSPWTARRIARAVLEAAVPGGGPVLELGAGTGAVTQAFLEAGCPIHRIVAVEQDPELCDALRQRFDGLRVLQGDALDLGPLLKAERLASVGVVLSGLPMRAIASDAAARCYGDAFRAMPAGGAIVQYTYGMRPPVEPDLEGLELAATFVGREWRNFPPMGIWRYSLRDAAGRRPSAAGN
jgi:phosphatidylethanolamine/phosphatidyl-N-methylethanolamine N-methyltransferase